MMFDELRPDWAIEALTMVAGEGAGAGSPSSATPFPPSATRSPPAACCCSISAAA